jgi:ABC-type Fe3+-hydroxamate transport system substrate-binding protein
MNFKDQTGTEIELIDYPSRIISVVPSQTELLFDLGLGKKVVGITKFCIHPAEWFKSKPRVGGTKKLDIEKIIQLQPDIIFANKEENEKADIEELKKHFPVWTSDIKNLEDALEMILEIGKITNTEKAAMKTTIEISEQFKTLSFKNTYKCIYLIWTDPIMTVGGDTFIGEMLNRSGFENLTSHKKRYPELTLKQLQALNPEILFLSTEPYPFKQEHADYFQKQLPDSIIKIVDGEMFSWYGSRLQKAPLYFSELRSEIENAS